MLYNTRLVVKKKVFQTGHYYTDRMIAETLSLRYQIPNTAYVYNNNESTNVKRNPGSIMNP